MSTNPTEDAALGVERTKQKRLDNLPRTIVEEIVRLFVASIGHNNPFCAKATYKQFLPYLGCVPADVRKLIMQCAFEGTACTIACKGDIPPCTISEYMKVVNVVEPPVRGIDLGIFSNLTNLFVGELDHDSALDFIDRLPTSLRVLRLADCLLPRMTLLAQIQRITAQVRLHELTDLSLDSRFCGIFTMPYLLPTVAQMAVSYPYETLDQWLTDLVDALRPLTNLRSLRIGIVFFANRGEMVSLLQDHDTHPVFAILSCHTCLASRSAALREVERRVITYIRDALPCLRIFECYTLDRATRVVPGIFSTEMQPNSLIKKFTVHQ